jgi:hypothetical protein
MLEPYCAGNVPNEALMLRSPSAPKPAFGCSAMARGRASRSTRAGATPRRGSRRRLRRLLTMRVRGLSDVGRNRFIAPFMRRADQRASMDACLPSKRRNKTIAPYGPATGPWASPAALLVVCSAGLFVLEVRHCWAPCPRQRSVSGAKEREYANQTLETFRRAGISCLGDRGRSAGVLERNLARSLETLLRFHG